MIFIFNLTKILFAKEILKEDDELIIIAFLLYIKILYQL